MLTPLSNLSALLSTGAGGYLVSTLLRNFHASILGIAIDTPFTISGLLAVLGGIAAMLNLQSLRQESLFILLRDEKSQQ